jgi:hypothetical protein
MMLAWALCGIATMALAQDAQVKGTRPLLSFEKPGELAGIKAIGASARRIERGDPRGGHALEVRFEPVERARLEIPVGAGDWRGYGSLVLDATNTSQEPVRFSVAARDQAGAQTEGQTWWALAPGQRASLSLSLNSPVPEKMGMQAEPPVEPFRALRSDHRPVDLSRMAAIVISMSKPAGARSMVFGAMRLGPGVSYEKISDRFGQYTRADWPGKVKSEADFHSQLAAEQAELKARPALPDRDEYGGWAGGPQLEATHYFRAQKQDGKWWLVTPGGHLFFSLGLDTVSVVEGGTIVEGRERMFEWLPAQGDPLAAHYQSIKSWMASGQEPLHRAFNFYTANLERKYGKDWYASWQAMTMARLPAWGFNTIGNWSDTKLYSLKKTPYVGTLEVQGDMQRISGMPPFPTLRIYDTFDPRFAPAVDQSVRGLATERRNDPWLVGYFVDNELPWGFMRSDRTRYALALSVLSLGPTSPAKGALVAELKQRYGSIQKFNAAWRAPVSSWDDVLRKPYRLKGDFSAQARADMGEFVKQFAERYYRTIRDALKKYDPNHLYLGGRFAWLVHEDFSWTTPEVEEVAARYCDVISFNVYLPRIDSRWDFLRRLDKPAIIGEFNSGAPGSGMFYPGVVPTANQAERARMYQDYVRSVAANPAFVGCHWFQYIDEPTTGRDDGENINTGFVTIADSPYREMVEAAKSINAEVYQIRSKSD